MMADKDTKVEEKPEDAVTDKEQVMDIEDLLFDGDVKEGAKDAEQPDEDAQESEAEADDEVDDAAEEGSEEEEESSEAEEDESEPEDEGPSYQELLDRIAKLEAKKGKEKEVEEPEAEEPTEVDVEEDFLKGKHFDDMSAKDINVLLNKIVKTAIEKALLLTPKIAMEQADQVQKVNTLVTSFYAENPDLADKKDLMKMVAMQVESEKPGISVKAALDETAKRVRKLLGQKKAMKEKEKAPKKVETSDVGLKKSSSSRGAPVTEGQKKNLATEIAETIFD